LGPSCIYSVTIVRPRFNVSEKTVGGETDIIANAVVSRQSTVANDVIGEPIDRTAYRDRFGVPICDSVTVGDEFDTENTRET